MECRLRSDVLGNRHIVDAEDGSHLACEVADDLDRIVWTLNLDLGERAFIVDYCQSIARMLLAIELVEGDTRTVTSMEDPKYHDDLSYTIRAPGTPG